MHFKCIFDWMRSFPAAGEREQTGLTDPAKDAETREIDTGADLKILG
jgi:hypothetical protein